MYIVQCHEKVNSFNMTFIQKYKTNDKKKYIKLAVQNIYLYP